MTVYIGKVLIGFSNDEKWVKCLIIDTPSGYVFIDEDGNVIDDKIWEFTIRDNYLTLNVSPMFDLLNNEIAADIEYGILEVEDPYKITYLMKPILFKRNKKNRWEGGTLYNYLDKDKEEILSDDGEVLNNWYKYKVNW